jgi:hypothetical protein
MFTRPKTLARLIRQLPDAEPCNTVVWYLRGDCDNDFCGVHEVEEIAVRTDETERARTYLYANQRVPKPVAA